MPTQYPNPGELRRKDISASKAGVLLLLVGLISLFTLAKHGQYLPKSNPANFTSRTIKISRDGSFQRRTEFKTCSQLPSSIFRSAAFSRPLRIPEENLLPTELTFLSSNQLRSPPTSFSLG